MALTAALKKHLPKPVRRALGKAKMRARWGWIPLERVSAALAANDIEDRAQLDAIRSIWVKLPPPPGDPSSAQYRQHWLDVYTTLSGGGYDVAREETVFEVEEATRSPFPYMTEDPQVVADHMTAVSAVIRTMDLPSGASVLELGCGWGNTSLALAQMGYDVTVLDIEERFIDLVKTRADALGVPIKTVLGDFFSIEEIDRRFDALLFFECFHHCIDHQRLLDALPAKLNPGGKLVLAGEVINNALPYEWGLNPNGEAIFQISTKGWMELSFRESYLLKTLRRKGWHVVRHDEVYTSAERVYICTREPQAAP